MDSRRKSKIHVRIIALIIVICLILVGVGFAVYYFVKPSSVSNPAITSSPINEDKHINIYFVRHGKTDANINNVFCGRGTDAKLIDEGRETTKKTGMALRDIKFHKVFTSELSRTLDTANIILEENNNGFIRLEPINLLNDIDWGDIEGKTDAEVSKEYPNYTFEQFIGTPGDTNFVSPIHASTENQMVNQFYEALKEICKGTPDGGNVLVVGHSSFVWLLDVLFPDKMKGIDGLNNSSITLIEYNKGKMSLKQVNVDADKFNV